MAGCSSEYRVHVRIKVYESNDIRVIPKPIADKMIKYGLAMLYEEYEELKKKGELMKIKILRNGKICDMPAKNAESYIRTGQAVAIDPVTKAIEKPVANKMVEKPIATKEVVADEETLFICPKCSKEYKTERGLANHSC